MRSSDRYAIAISVSMILASLTLGPLTQDRTYLGVSWLLILLINAVGLLSRRTRAGWVGALVGQIAAVALFAVWESAAMAGGSIGFVQRVGALFTSASEHMQTESAPMTPNDGVKF